MVTVGQSIDAVTGVLGLRDAVVLAQNAQTVVVRAVRADDGAAVVAKVRTLAWDPAACERLRAEHRLASALVGSSFPRILGLRQGAAGVSALEMVDEGLVPVLDSVPADGLPTGRFFDLAIAVTDALRQLHDQGVVHGDVKPDNLGLRPDGHGVVLLDFDRAFLTADGAQRRGGLGGTLAYLAPEQTGRTGRGVDRRADLYGLGVTLFQLATGRTPFQVVERRLAFHQHLTATPPSVAGRRPDLPAMVDALVAKLLAKYAEERYASADGVLADLERCRAAWVATGDVPSFALGDADVRDGLALPERTYGREAQAATLAAAWDRVSDGGVELVLVAGASGVGKSSLVGELTAAVLESGGRAATGRFQDMRVDVPYTGVVEALEEVLREVAGRPRGAYEAAVERLRAVLGGNTGVVAALLPTLRSLVGEPGPLAPLSPAAERVRFEQTTTDFVAALTHPHEPLLLVFDDVQWADEASIAWLRRVLLAAAEPDAPELGGEAFRRPRPTHLLVVCAFRSNEVGHDHPFAEALREVEGRWGRTSTRIDLEALTRADVAALLRDALPPGVAGVEALAERVFALTRGNAFVVRRLLGRADRAGLFRGLRRGDRVEPAVLDAVDPGSRVDDLVLGELLELPEATRQALATAAALGRTFRLAELGSVLGESEAGVLARLAPAVAIQLVHELAPERPGWLAFAHDRVQQAGWGLLDLDERRRVHRLAMRARLDGAERAASPAAASEIVHHATLAGLDGLDADVAARLVPWFTLAAHQARAQGAWGPARERYAAGLHLLGEAGWATAHDTAWSLAMGEAEASFLLAAWDDTYAAVDRLEARARDAVQRGRARTLRLMTHLAREAWRDALDTCRDAIGELGSSLPAEPTKLRILAALLRTLWWYRDGTRFLLARPPIADERAIVASRLVSLATVASTLAQPQLMPLQGFESMRIHRVHGPGPELPAALAIWSVVLMAGLDDLERAKESIATANAYLDAHPSDEARARVLLVEIGWVRHWEEPLHAIADSLLTGYHLAARVGSNLYVGFDAATYVLYALLGGRNLLALAATIDSVREPVRRSGVVHCIGDVARYEQTVRNLRGQAADVLVLKSEHYDVDADEAYQIAMSGAMSASVIPMLKALVATVYGDAGRAWAATRQAEPLLESLAGTAWQPLFHVMHPLAALRSVGTPEGPTKRAALRIADAALKRLRRWAPRQPALYRSRIRLLEAERARVAHGPAAGVDAWEEAAAACGPEVPLFEAAWTAELGARGAAEAGRTFTAEALLHHARQLWSRWGADAKVRALDAELVRTLRAWAPTTSSGSLSDTQGLLDRRDDLELALRATRRLAMRIRLPDVVREVLGVACQASGARRAVLVLELDGEPTVVGVALEGQDVTPARVPLADFRDVAGPAVLSVLRTGRLVEVGDASAHAQWRAEPWVRRGKVRSMAAVPLVHGDATVGVVVVENDLLPDLFEADRLELAARLAGQAAVALEHALLVEGLQRRVDDGARELADARDRSDRLLRAVLPGPVVHELTTTGAVPARRVDAASMIVARLADFPAAADQLPAAEVVAELDRTFDRLDAACGERVARLGTLGDAWVGVTGVPAPSDTHAPDAVLAALRLSDALVADPRGAPWRLQIAVHTGPVTAGLLGRRVRYGVWGGTALAAGRLATMATPGVVTVSEATWALVQGLFVGASRDGGGTVVHGIRAELAADVGGRVPNEAFWARWAEVRG